MREVKGLDPLVDVGDGALHAREDPAVLEALRAGRRQNGLDVEENQPRGVPELVREVTSLLDLGLGKADVLRRGHRQQAEAQRIGAVLGDLVERIDAVAQ